MTSEEMKRALELIVEHAQTGMICVSNDEKELLRRYAQIMGEWSGRND